MKDEVVIKMLKTRIEGLLKENRDIRKNVSFLEETVVRLNEKIQMKEERILNLIEEVGAYRRILKVTDDNKMVYNEEDGVPEGYWN